LQAAQKLLAERGFRETNLNDVATQLGFRRQAVYHYVRSKEEMLYGLLDRAGEAVASSVQPTLDADLAPAEMLAQVVRGHVRQLLTNVDWAVAETRGETMAAASECPCSNCRGALIASNARR
jgi:AcrR family transcriptional regulator